MVTRSRSVLVYLLATILFAGSHLQVSAAISGVLNGSANGASVSGTVTVLGVPATVSLVSAAPVTLPGGGTVTNQVASAGVKVPGRDARAATGFNITRCLGDTPSNRTSNR